MTELTISLETGSGRPLYEQIYNHIKTEILNGGLPFQKRLPSTRKLAQYLQVSRSTVDMAYEPVSYTHLDVYKRQALRRNRRLINGR